MPSPSSASALPPASPPLLPIQGCMSFITMNPGYLGRAELPESLKVRSKWLSSLGTRKYHVIAARLSPPFLLSRPLAYWPIDTTITTSIRTTTRETITVTTTTGIASRPSLEPSSQPQSSL
eukprot:4268119-Pleurochrysis_carterae.AAC.2